MGSGRRGPRVVAEEFFAWLCGNQGHAKVVDNEIGILLTTLWRLLCKKSPLTKENEMKTFRTLDLSVEFYELSEKSDVKGNLRDQLLRAASSISLNLAEGNAKRTVPEKKRYYQMAYASVQECKTILRLAKVSDENILNTMDKLGAWIFNLLKSEIKVQKFF
jgi:four helix bundle protein